MNSPESETSGAADLSRLEYQCRSLRHWLVSVLALVLLGQMLMIIVSGTLTVYLLLLSRSTSKDLVEYRPQATKIINDYQQVSAPRMNDFLKKITEYARAHPDFAPILAKYGIKPGSPTGEAPTAATSLPVVPPKP